MKNKKQNKKDIEKRIYFLIKNKINHWSGTISPAPKDDDNIESVEKALEYYKDNLVDEVVIQPKYMGSYICMYLKKDLYESKFFSRNGYEIADKRENRFDRNEFFESIKPIHEKIFNKYPLLKIAVVEGELLPWNAIGQKLINDNYVNYSIVHKNQLKHLNQNLIEKIKSIDVNQTDNRTKKFLNQFDNTRMANLEEYEESVTLYEKQLNIFNVEENIHVKPFKLLKLIYNHDIEKVIYDNSVLMNLFNYGDVINVNDVQKAKQIFEKYSNENMEGVMIKPKISCSNMSYAPSLKIRTKKYLQLIYGINFDKCYDYFLEKRNIKSKLRASVKDFNIKNNLLEINYNDLNKKNNNYVNLLYSALNAEKYNNEKLDKNL